MFDKTKAQILASSINQDQDTVAQQWANTFIFNSKGNQAVPMAQMLLACVAWGDFKVRPYLSKSPELGAPSDQLNIVDYISHASRIIIDYQGLSASNKEELLSLFPGRGDKIFARSATHNAYRAPTGKVIEGKGFLLGVVGQLPWLIKTPQDFGINIAMGGEGQRNYYGKKISDNGYSGHFYFHRNDPESLLMLGLEQSAPAGSPLELVWGGKKYDDEEQQYHDQFGQGHSLVGASDTYTAAGSLYFSDPVYQTKLMLEKGVFPPDKYGAMQVKVNDENWPLIKEFFLKLTEVSKNEREKEQLIQLLKSKPSTAKATKDEYLSYIALDFDAYLKRIYEVFIHVEELDVESQGRFSVLQANLLATIKLLQKGNISSYERFILQIRDLISLPDTPAEYRNAILRIAQLFELQIKIDPELERTNQQLLLKTQYDDLQEESKAVLEKLTEIQLYFERNPPAEDQVELKLILQIVDNQIRILKNPLGPLEEEILDISSSWVMCEVPDTITVESIDKLKRTIEESKDLLQQSILTCSRDVSFSQVLKDLDHYFLPLSQVNLLDYKQINISDLAKQFNEYIASLAEQAETLNLWDHHPEQTANFFTAFSEKNKEFDFGYAFIEQYRESTILKRLLSLDPETTGTNRIKPYEVPAARYRHQYPESYWNKVIMLLTAGSDVISLLRTLKQLQLADVPWEGMSETAISLKEAVTRFKEAKESVENHIERAPKVPKQSFESPYFYAISDESLHQMSGAQLATICLEELNSPNPSILVKRIIQNQKLWETLDECLKTGAIELAVRKDNIEEKIKTLRQIRHFHELIAAFRENNLLIKGAFLRELQSLVKDCTAIFGADEALREVEEEYGKLNEFFTQLRNLQGSQNKYEALLQLEQQYERLTEKEKTDYKSQMLDAVQSVYEFSLSQLHPLQTIDNKIEIFNILANVYAKLSPTAKEEYQLVQDVKQKENDLFKIHVQLKNAGSVKEKRDVFNQPLFNQALRDFETVSRDIASESAKKVHKQLVRAELIYNSLEQSGVIKQDSPTDEIDIFLNQDPMLKKTLQKQLIETVLQDKIFRDEILKKVKAHSFSPVLIQDLLTIKQFRDQKIKLSEEKNYGEEYNQSINNFYQQALAIRLSEKPIKQQVQEILNTAHKEFKQRDEGLRLIADVVMLVSSLAGVGLLVGAGRLALGKTFFFSSYMNEKKNQALGNTLVANYLSPLITDREAELINDWLQSDEDENKPLFSAPGA